MAQNNLLTSYPTWIYGYPTLWLQWQRTFVRNWLDIWTKSTPTAFNGIEQTLSVQQQLIQTFLEIEEKYIQQSLDMQKMFWKNYFQFADFQKKQGKEMTQNLEPFPTLAKVSR